MNEKTFRRIIPKVKLSVCPHKIQNFGNSVADISILGQFRTYLQFKGEKYLNTFIVTNANDCPNLLSHGATFRMGVLLPNYPEENVVKGESVPNFKINTSKGASSNVFQIMQDLQLKQYEGQYHPSTIPSTMPKQHKGQFHSGTTSSTVLKQYKGQYHCSTIPGTAPKQCEEQYHAHRLRKTLKYHPQGTEHGTIGYLFQDHHTLHSYNWKNNNKTGQSSTCTSRNFT